MSELSYSWQVSVETIYIAVQTFLYSLLLYSMIGFEWGATKFLWFYYYVFMCFVYFTFYGMMLVALTPSYQIAAILMSFFLSFWNLFSGFLIPRMVRKHQCFLKNKPNFLTSWPNSMTNSAADPCVVEMVLLGLSSCLDNLRARDIAGWRK